jgi:hypothetical protein
MESQASLLHAQLPYIAPYTEAAEGSESSQQHKNKRN